MADLKEKRKTKKDLKSKIKTKTSAYQTGQLEKKKKKKSSPNGPNQKHASWLFSNELLLLARKKIKKKTVHSIGKYSHAYLLQNCFLKLPN